MKTTLIMCLLSVLVIGTPLYLMATRPPRIPGQISDMAAMDAFLGQLVKSGNPPGISFVVVKDGQVVYERAFGTINASSGREVTVDTVYHWWSVTKIPTAIAVLQLHERGLLDLDQPVQTYLPWFKVQAPTMESKPVTVRHLLNHSSGLPDPMPEMLGWVHDGARVNQTDLTRQQLVRFHKLRFEPGSQAKYTNLGYMVLGAVIETVTGQPYEDYVTEQILEPLGMTKTGFVYREELAQHEAAGSLPLVHLYTPILPFYLDMSKVIRQREGKLLWLNRVYLDATPPSGLIGPVSDMATFMIALLNHGELNGQRLMRSDTSDYMLRGSPIGRNGIGWFHATTDGRYHVQHEGGGPGFATILRLYPNESLGIAIMANGTDLDRDGIADVLSNLDYSKAGRSPASR